MGSYHFRLVLLLLHSLSSIIALGIHFWMAHPRRYWEGFLASLTFPQRGDDRNSQSRAWPRVKVWRTQPPNDIQQSRQQFRMRGHKHLPHSLKWRTDAVRLLFWRLTRCEQSMRLAELVVNSFQTNRQYRFLTANTVSNHNKTVH
jgi:hypothetical protein